MKQFLLFSTVSFFVSALDVALFGLLNRFVLVQVPYSIIWSTVIARIISASINYAVNRKLVFQSHEDRRKSSIQFAVLTVVQCSLSAGLVYGLEWLFAADSVILKVIVDVGLFFLSYAAQRMFIFK